MTQLLYLGIDPSLSKTGFAILRINNDSSIERLAYCFKSDVRHTTAARIACMRNAAQAALALQGVDATLAGACIEGPSMGSVGRHDELGQVRGVFSVWLFDQGIQCVQVPPTCVKKFAAGTGAADKEDMIKAAREFGWDVPPRQDDMADAACLAEVAFGLQHRKTQRLRRVQLEVLALPALQLPT